MVVGVIEGAEDRLETLPEVTSAGSVFRPLGMKWTRERRSRNITWAKEASPAKRSEKPGSSFALAHALAVGAVAAEIDEHRTAVGAGERAGERDGGQRPAGFVDAVGQSHHDPLGAGLRRSARRSAFEQLVDALAIGGASVGVAGIMRRTP